MKKHHKIIEILRNIRLQDITHIVAIVGVILGLIQFKHVKEIESARLIVDFNNQLRNNDHNYSKIIDAIGNNDPLLKPQGKFTEVQIDNYLVEWELINNFYAHGLVSEETLYDAFAYDIEKAYCNKEIRQYIVKVKKDEKSSDMFGGFEEISKKFLSMDKEDCPEKEK
jgi:hypothetical protein